MPDEKPATALEFLPPAEAIEPELMPTPVITPAGEHELIPYAKQQRVPDAFLTHETYLTELYTTDPEQPATPARFELVVASTEPEASLWGVRDSEVSAASSWIVVWRTDPEHLESEQFTTMGGAGDLYWAMVRVIDPSAGPAS